MDWDIEVDLICTGSGAGGMATAISVADVGGDVFIARSAGDPPPGDPRRHPWLAAGTSDVETLDYLAQLSSDLGPLRRSRLDSDVPIRVVHEPVPTESTRTIPPFVGAKLREWAARCLASPYGYLYTRLSNWQSTPLQTADGELIEVAEIGAMRPDVNDVGGSVLEWLTAQARDRGIETQDDATLRRIVFEEGVAIGAVFSTADGTLAVGARHGLVVTADRPQRVATPGHLPDDVTLRVCLVGRHASRFGRVELLTSEPVERFVPPTCRSANRQLHVNMHETQANSPAWRCGKVHGYPPLSE